MTQQHPNHPSVEAFLGTPYDPAEDEAPEPLTIGPGQLWQIPPTPIESIAGSLRNIENILHDRLGSSQKFEAVLSTLDVPQAPLADTRVLEEELADTDAKLEEAYNVINRVANALGKSKAAPALAAKQVIEAWRNPTVPDTTETEGEEPEGVQMTEMGSEAWAAEEAVAAQAYADGTQAIVANPDSLPGHTRTPHPEGADFCRECTGETQEWILWPCPAVSGAPQSLPTGPEEGYEPVAQPAHDAPVEEWRAYARALGFAGPDIDKANRSVIRTTLGIAQPTS